MPAISGLNLEAYRVINDLERQARNLVATRLSLGPWTGHILKGRAVRFNEKTGRHEDAHQRAAGWRADSIDKGLLNPLPAYLSTRYLAFIIKEIGKEMGSQPLRSIADALLELSGIRDAVMHNQLVDAAALLRLHELRADVYEALGQIQG
jgi:hypothetical protein